MKPGLINRPWLRERIDALPEGNPAVIAIRTVSKALLFRRRILRSQRIVFPGLEDAIFEKTWGVGAGPGEILVRSLYTSVSPGTERAGYLNLPNFRVSWPYQPGYGGCGVVMKAGRGVLGFQRGNLVAGIFKHSSHNILDLSQLVPVPRGVKPEEAALVTMGVIARCGVRAAGIKPGEKVLVLGLGILGQLAIQMARLAGAGAVAGAARSGAKAEMARDSGADPVLDLDGRHGVSGGDAPDAVIDATGALPGFMTALGMVREGGRVVMLGSLPGLRHEAPWPELVVRKGLTVSGAHIRNLEAEGLNYSGEAAAFLDDVAAGKIRLGHLITDIISSEDAPALYSRLAKGAPSMVGILFHWTKGTSPQGAQ